MNADEMRQILQDIMDAISVADTVELKRAPVQEIELNHFTLTAGTWIFEILQYPQKQGGSSCVSTARRESTVVKLPPDVANAALARALTIYEGVQWL